VLEKQLIVQPQGPHGHVTTSAVTCKYHEWIRRNTC